MKKITSVFLFLFTCAVMGQKTEMDTFEGIQKTLNLSSMSLNVEESLIEFGKLYKLNQDYSFKSIYSNIDERGIKHEKFQQFYKGTKVEFGIVIVHSENNYVNSVNGELYNMENVVLTRQLSNSTAFEFAKASVNANRYLWEDEEQSAVMKYSKPEGEVVLFSNVNTKKSTIAYKFDIYALSPISRQEVYIDANNGSVLFNNPIIKHAHRLVTNDEIDSKRLDFENALFAVSGSAATRYSGTRSIETTFMSGLYVLQDTSRGNGIVTYNSARTNNYNQTHFVDNDNNWIEHANANKDNAALDAHWGAEMTYDFWNTIFSRNSYDNNGAEIKSFVHYDDVPGGAGYFNAFWNGSVMTYGDGSTKPLTSIDICGHEIGHAVCTHTANLVYANQSGAMNEGFSDIWGACIEHFGRTGSISGTPVSNVWAIGEDITTGGLRSMSSPLSKGNPDTYLGTNWTTTGDEGSCTPGSGNDNCGVHNNSGVLNHWFYILSAGKSGTNNAPVPDTYNVTGIGINKAAQIAYYAERDYLTPNSTYADARNATISVVNSLYCANSPEAIAVTNAWYAVNVGNQYSAIANDVALDAVTGVSSITCGTVATPILKIKNQGTNAISTISISYTIDGGTPVNNTWNGSLAACADFNYSLNLGVVSRGSHVLAITTTIVSDGRSENNTKTVNLLVNDSGSVGVVNPFTNATNTLISYKDGSTSPLWTRGVRSDASSLDSSGNSVYTTNLSGNYPDVTKAYLVSQCYNLTNVSNPSIEFKMKFDLEQDWDIVYVQYSTNFGANWTVLGSMGANWYNSNRTNASSGGADCFNCPGAQWTGTDTTLKTYTYPLTSLGSPSNVIFRIVFHSDEAANQLGVNIDDFVINGVLSNESFELNNVEIYPNPSNGIFNISFGSIEPTSVEVYDITGKKVLYKVGNSSSVLDLTSVAQGIYFVKINADNKQIVKRIIKQ